MKVLASIAVSFALFGLVFADVYMHNPRGSNNRLDEQNRDRDNANRLFDSQNNEKGGYNQNDMIFYGGSELRIQWTHQHGCDSNWNNCEIIFQYYCDGSTNGNTIRDGQTRTTIATATPNQASRGRHEELSNYNDCKTRRRNFGLFIADQDLTNKNSADFTRQNNNGARYGFECPEERDYYPYWHPSPWRDIAVLTTNPSRCAYYQAESANVKGKNYCDGLKEPDPNNAAKVLSGAYYNNEGECIANGFQWKMEEPFNLPAPECLDANKVAWSRVNHLGNNKDAEENHYNWILPYMPVDSTCVLRLRYNISTNDYDGWNTFSEMNGPKLSPIKNDPTYDLRTGLVATATTGIKLKLDINTDQFGRTFQDRSHTFIIRNPPVAGRIVNLNVQGQRGNIVENYPSVEYDFVPSRLTVSTSDYIHRQVTGSNTSPDGAGQGRAATDRHSFIELAGSDASRNYPEYLTNLTMIENSNSQDGYKTAKRMATLNQNDNELDDAAPYQDFGVMRYSSPRTINYMSARTNNFSNRSEKGTIIVQSPADKSKKNVPVAIIAGAAAGGVVVIAIVGVVVWAAMTGKFTSAGASAPKGYA